MNNKKPMIQWKDVTSYQQGDTERKPNSFELRVGSFRIRLHRLHKMTAWYISCEPFYFQCPLTAVYAGDAKDECVWMVRDKLTTDLQLLIDWLDE